MLLSKMSDESRFLSAKSWARAANSIIKVGYMDGAADGQKAAFQTSFDSGYKQGFSFGMELGINEAKLRFHSNEKVDQLHLRDPMQINCHICLDPSRAQDLITDLYNNQKEKNCQYLHKLKLLNG